VHLDIGAKETKEVIFILGQGRDRTEAEALARRWQDPLLIEPAFEALGRYWDRRLGAIRVRTPDPAFDLMVNRWLLYQTMASRVMARAGFYQAGGAFGFRDQLQDMLAVLHTDPARTRAHILAAAARQFEEGDVLHWWHPPTDRGVRTRCSDDLLWLPYVASRYVAATGDESILNEEVPYLRADPLRPDENDRYDRFEAGVEPGPLLEHCERALERGVTRGPHGLTLIGTGDWNDGLDRVGRAGRGESVWLAWFAIATMREFAALSSRVGREDLAGRWTNKAEELGRAVEAAGWDGAWYMRAFDDEGRPWGSATSEECRIDSIAQSWAVLSGAGGSERTRIALDSAARELVCEDDRLVRLLWPPFDTTPRDPGYIKAYPPGIRENGGQYSHAAAWLGLAFAKIGDGKRASRVFDLINPIHRAASHGEAEHYRVEPYVVAADVAGVTPHTGRGGWTWYTGASAWTWRLAVEGILGLTRVDGGVVVDPCLPPSWPSVAMEVRGPGGTLVFQIDNPDPGGRRAVELIVDGLPFKGMVVAFPTDGSTRRVDVRTSLRRVETGAT
jgi:cyclic beta-1,2-glucan synthetase